MVNHSFIWWGLRRVDRFDLSASTLRSRMKKLGVRRPAAISPPG